MNITQQRIQDYNLVKKDYTLIQQSSHQEPDGFRESISKSFMSIITNQLLELISRSEHHTAFSFPTVYFVSSFFQFTRERYISYTSKIHYNAFPCRNIQNTKGIILNIDIKGVSSNGSTIYPRWSYFSLSHTPLLRTIHDIKKQIFWPGPNALLKLQDVRIKTTF